jgi:hypothetical protein
VLSLKAMPQILKSKEVNQFLGKQMFFCCCNGGSSGMIIMYHIFLKRLTALKKWPISGSPPFLEEYGRSGVNPVVRTEPLGAIELSNHMMALQTV